MNKIKVMTVFGTRPEAIKMAPLVYELEKRDEIQSLVCVTAQHRQMLDQVLNMFKITPDFDLDIMKERQTLVGITTRAIEGLDRVMSAEKPDIVLVHGDTSTTFAGSLAAFYNHAMIGHVEAGLRTYDKWSPYPEEMNRRLTGALADLHFSPTKKNKNNLLAEGVSEDKIFITGNTVIDALKTTVSDSYKFDSRLAQIFDGSSRVILMTAHRRENLGEPLKNIANAVLRIVNEFEDIKLVYPVHLNPAVREVANSILGNHDRIYLIDPLEVGDMHNAMAKAHLILTDSGGLQEEAPSLGKPVLVLRKETERPEAIDAGTVRLAGIEEENIYNMTKQLLSDDAEYEKMSKAVNPYGDGLASKRIVDAILYNFGLGERPADLV
ncbi:MAG: UDP-N-acetylglucosamine 2-epimerase (non-hydrolyzing) [Clostridia bacterium]|nr:UDP-N-acetylglucosamine 2-epimerase (non-hydrolyzing) [Clostridia bacterium]